ncbi:hypothetical protein D3C71_1547870 [compost metagenome]
MIEAERRTNGQHPLTDLELLGVAQLDDRQVLALDLEERHVGTRVSTDQLGLELAAVRQTDDDLVGIGYHVVVGQHVAIAGDDEARAQRLGLTLAITARRTGLLRHVALEELAEHRRQAFQVGHLPGSDTAIRQLLLGTDVDHGRRGLLDQGGEVRQGFLGLGGEHLAKHEHGGEHR